MELRQRKPNRLKGYDYSKNGVYFITICTKDRYEMLWNVGATFGRPNNTNQHLSKYGLIIDDEIHKIESVYDLSVSIDKYVIMPNHLHLIILLNNDCDITGRPKVAPTISRIIQQFKGSVTKQIGFSVWQKLFHDHIICNEQEYQKIREYIDTNPLKWEIDCFYLN